MAEPLQASARTDAEEYYDGAAYGGEAPPEPRPMAPDRAKMRNDCDIRVSPDVNEPASPSQYGAEERVVPERNMTREEKAALIPDWAALLFACGIIAAGVGFVAVWLVDSAIPMMLMAVGFAFGAAAIRIARCKTATVRIN
jgi:hypothetical protein